MDVPSMRRESLAYTVFLAHRFEYVLNHHIADTGLTTKQVLLLATIMREPEPPSLAVLARRLRFSYQNIKQIVDVLERKGFVELEPDPCDGRALRVVPTDRNAVVWEGRDYDRATIARMFEVLSEDEQIVYHELVLKLLGHNDGLLDAIKDARHG